MKKIYGFMLAAAMIVSLPAKAEQLEYLPYIGMDYINSDMNLKGVGNFGPHYDSLSFNVGTTIGKYFGTEMFAQHSDTDKRSHGLKTNIRAYGLDTIGYLPIGCELRFAVLGSFGVGEYRFSSKNSAVGLKKHTDHGWGWRTGLGFQYNLTNNWSARVMARHVNFEGIDRADHMMEYTAGIRYFF